MVKPGYKQTEIGVIPEDWDIKKIINLSAGGLQNGTFYEGSRKGTGVYFLNVGNLYQTAPIVPQTLEKFDASKDEIERLIRDITFCKFAIKDIEEKKSGPEVRATANFDENEPVGGYSCDCRKTE